MLTTCQLSSSSSWCIVVGMWGGGVSLTGGGEGGEWYQQHLFTLLHCCGGWGRGMLVRREGRGMLWWRRKSDVLYSLSATVGIEEGCCGGEGRRMLGGAWKWVLWWARKRDAVVG